MNDNLTGDTYGDEEEAPPQAGVLIRAYGPSGPSAEGASGAPPTEDIVVQIPALFTERVQGSELDKAKRDEAGKFLPGAQGNPRGRPVGSLNRANLIKRLIEDKLSHKLEKEAIAIMQQAINMAKRGDKAMIKLLLGDILAPVRNGLTEGQKGLNAGTVRIILENYTGQKARIPETITDAEVVDYEHV